MVTSGMVTLIAFLMASSLVLLVYTLAGGRAGRLEARLDELAGRGGTAIDQDTMMQLARTALPKMGTPLLPSSEEERTRLQSRLLQAGLYRRQAMVVFLGVKLLLIVSPIFVALAVSTLGILPFSQVMLAGISLSMLGMIAPSFWLDRQRNRRKSSLRRALPDALDVMVVCLEGGLSLPGAMRYVAGELKTAHPLLAGELNIVQREVQLGKSPGEALRELGIRSDLEEIRTLAAVITQSSRFGASLVKSLRVHGELLRLKRQQQAEEMAQKAATKVLFPTILFIFPAMFIVILGPAMIHIAALLSKVALD
jgi:tight adherence protein C